MTKIRTGTLIHSRTNVTNPTPSHIHPPHKRIHIKTTFLTTNNTSRRRLNHIHFFLTLHFLFRLSITIHIIHRRHTPRCQRPNNTTQRHRLNPLHIHMLRNTFTRQTQKTRRHMNTRIYRSRSPRGSSWHGHTCHTTRRRRWSIRRSRIPCCSGCTVRTSSRSRICHRWRRRTHRFTRTRSTCTGIKLLRWWRRLMLLWRRSMAQIHIPHGIADTVKLNGRGCIRRWWRLSSHGWYKSSSSSRRRRRWLCTWSVIVGMVRLLWIHFDDRRMLGFEWEKGFQ
mmetsp:Transcript_2826/g.3933  ORF Transcript_2826/g.3933 Transcript_2826/m.3933 type:complete len:281 (+) Transcript_2826:2136-2978(+)